MNHLNAIHFIFYVEDQERSKFFYENVLGIAPRLHVPGMTEFELSSGVVLGLMPENGIKRLLGGSIPDLKQAKGVPKAELYLLVENPEEYYQRAIVSGAKELSPFEKRSWGHRAAYCSDHDGHIIAFADLI